MLEENNIHRPYLNSNKWEITVRNLFTEFVWNNGRNTRYYKENAVQEIGKVS